MAKILPASVDLGAGDSSGYNPITVGGNAGLPVSVSSPLASQGSIGATSTSTAKIKH
jgi:hypothetical protein